MKSLIQAAEFYAFESIEATSLALIPLSIRYKLDCCGIKLHLRQWQKMSLAQRTLLLQTHCSDDAEIAAYAALLRQIIQQIDDGEADPQPFDATAAWRITDAWPATIIAQCQAQSLSLPSLSGWRQLAPAQRHALLTLAKSRHESHHLAAAFAQLLPLDATHCR